MSAALILLEPRHRCSICLDLHLAEELICFPCGHAFGSQCLIEYTKSRDQVRRPNSYMRCPMCQKECSKSSLHPLFLEFVQGSSKDSLSSQTEAAAIALLDHLETTGTDTMKRSEIAGAQKEMRTLAEAMKSDGLYIKLSSRIDEYQNLVIPALKSAEMVKKKLDVQEKRLQQLESALRLAQSQAREAEEEAKMVHGQRAEAERHALRYRAELETLKGERNQAVKENRRLKGSLEEHNKRVGSNKIKMDQILKENERLHENVQKLKEEREPKIKTNDVYDDQEESLLVAENSIALHDMAYDECERPRAKEDNFPTKRRRKHWDDELVVMDSEDLHFEGMHPPGFGGDWPSSAYPTHPVKKLKKTGRSHSVLKLDSRGRPLTAVVLGQRGNGRL